jgi:VanZ family protein
LTPEDRPSKLALRLPLLLWTAVILAVSSVPGPTLLKVGFSVKDGLAHGIEYGVLGFLIYRLQRAEGRVGLAACCAAVVGGALLGGLDETYQRFIPGRVPSWTDYAADLAGSGLGGLAAAIYYHAWDRHVAGRSTRMPAEGHEEERQR